MIINEFYHLNFKNFFVNNKIINSGVKPNNFQLIENHRPYDKNNKRKNF